MNCSEALPLVDAYADDELDARSSLELQAHLDGCASCRAAHDGVRALKRAIRGGATRFAPSPKLLGRIRPRRAWPLALVPLAAALAALGVFVTPAPDDALVDAHVRSLQAAHLVDVESTDRHTVKPWFQGRVDFGVPLVEADGFELVGGRLDQLGGRPAAALVYRRRQHVVNVFVTRGAAAASEGRRSGYAIVTWSADGLQYRAISDLDVGELRALARPRPSPSP